MIKAAITAVARSNNRPSAFGSKYIRARVLTTYLRSLSTMYSPHGTSADRIQAGGLTGQHRIAQHVGGIVPSQLGATRRVDPQASVAARDKSSPRKQYTKISNKVE